jgi:hypothetical protein
MGLGHETEFPFDYLENVVQLKINSLITVFNRPGIIVGEHNGYEWVVEYMNVAGQIVRARVNKHDVKERKA